MVCGKELLIVVWVGVCVAMSRDLYSVQVTIVGWFDSGAYVGKHGTALLRFDGVGDNFRFSL